SGSVEVGQQDLCVLVGESRLPRLGGSAGAFEGRALEQAVPGPPDALPSEAALEWSLSNILETAEPAVRVDESAFGIQIGCALGVVGAAAGEKDLAAREKARDGGRIAAHPKPAGCGVRRDDEHDESGCQGKCRQRC